MEIKRPSRLTNSPRMIAVLFRPFDLFVRHSQWQWGKPWPKGWWQRGLLIATYLLVHTFFDAHAKAFQTPLNVTTWYPSIGFTLAFMLYYGPKSLPLVAFGYLAINLLVWENGAFNIYTILPPLFNSIASLAGAQYLHKHIGSISRPWTLQMLAHFGVGTLLTSTLAGISIIGFWISSGLRPSSVFFPSLMEWMLGDVIGISIVAPFMLVIFIPHLSLLVRDGIQTVLHQNVRFLKENLFFLADLLIGASLLISVIYLVFFSSFGQTYNLLFLNAIPVLWAVLRHGFRGAVLVATTIAISGLASVLYLDESTRFISSRTDIYIFQLFTMILTLASYTLGAAIDELRRAKKSIERHRRELEETVRHRTMELVQENAERRRAEDDLIRINDMLEQRVLDRTKALNEARLHAEHMSEAKTQFLQNISHELRTPLNAVIGFSQLLTREELGPLGQAKYRDYAQNIHSAGSHLLSLVGDLLEMASLTGEERPLQKTVRDLRPMVEEALSMSKPRADAKNIRLAITTHDAAIYVEADQHRLLQVLLNLIGNAIKFSPENSLVDIRLSQENRDAIIEITDQGPGIAEADLPLVFERFWRGNRSDISSVGGMGLGLSIAHSLIQKHGGNLSLGNVPDKGICATIRLPLSAHQATSPDTKTSHKNMAP
ncbi:hypothetical protein JCM17845_28130 [Iodidimonas gelatinilytica]|uniref:histidine kinase n=2 Tax=Iodidimonas gelatinilytica TaxID=1236966 RepID=A0A5A7N4A5_9PROT|nr:hypothetical protein JCM17845_28130 [Iodidimonas gelatinilytica]